MPRPMQSNGTISISGFQTMTLPKIILLAFAALLIAGVALGANTDGPACATEE